MRNEHEPADRKDAIIVPVRLDQKTFRRFAVFDALTVRKQGRRPLVFALILMASAFAALLLRKEQSGVIAAVLFVIGLGLPIVYIGTFLSQINVQAERFRLGDGRKVYTVTLTDDGITVQNHQKEEEILHLEWKDIWKAWRRKGCIYLYVTREKAFLLPAGQANVPDETLWAFCCARGARGTDPVPGANR